MLRLKCLGGPLYGQEYSHADDEFIFKDKQTGKQTIYRKQTLNFTPPQGFLLSVGFAHCWPNGLFCGPFDR
ncbi:TPA: hypothetical protein VAM28_003425 [Acinetobacter baumannii]|nr:hypothetical protein [Acinetobacter baumannii]